MEIKKQPYVRINRTNYLDEDGLDALWLKIKEYVALHGGGGEEIDLTKYTTKKELAAELSKYYDRTEIDNLLSNINPDVDLSNYYTKQETYNKNEVNKLVENSSGGGTGQDGFSPIARVEQTETGATITITDKTGMTTASISNGIDGKNGSDGYSPIIAENNGNNTSTYKLDITTNEGMFTTPNLKGADGINGDADLSDYYTKEETYNKEEIDNKIVSNTYEKYSLDNKYTKRADALWDTIPTYSPKTALIKPLNADYNVYINTSSGDTLYYDDYISCGASTSEVGTVKDCYIIGTGDGSRQPKYETPGVEYIEELPDFIKGADGDWTFGIYNVQKRKVYKLTFEETIYYNETCYINNTELVDVTDWTTDNRVTNPEEGYLYTYKRTKIGEKTFKALYFYEEGTYSFYNKNSKKNTINCVDSNHDTIEHITLNNATIGQDGMIPNFINVSNVQIGKISNLADEKFTWVYYVDPDDFDGLITVKGNRPYNELVGDNDIYEGKYKITFTAKQANESGDIIDSTASKECSIYLDSPLTEREYIRLSDLPMYRNLSKEIEQGIEDAYTVKNPVENLSEWLSDTLINGSGADTPVIDLSKYYSLDDYVVESKGNDTLKIKYDFGVDRVPDILNKYPLRVYEGTSTITSDFTWDKMLISMNQNTLSTEDNTINISDYIEIPYSDSIKVSSDTEQNVYDYIIVNPKSNNETFISPDFLYSIRNIQDIIKHGSKNTIFAGYEFWEKDVYYNGKIQAVAVFKDKEQMNRFIENDVGSGLGGKTYECFLYSDLYEFERTSYYYDKTYISGDEGKQYTVSADDALVFFEGMNETGNVVNGIAKELKNSYYVYTENSYTLPKLGFEIIVAPVDDTAYHVVKGGKPWDSGVAYNLTVTSDTKPELTNTISIKRDSESIGYLRKNSTCTIIKTINLENLSDSVDLSNYYTKEEVDGKIPTVPTKLSELANDTNYLKYQVVSSLPEQQEEGVLYLVTN